LLCHNYIIKTLLLKDNIFSSNYSQIAVQIEGHLMTTSIAKIDSNN
jgi:hypothetical protein